MLVTIGIGGVRENIRGGVAFLEQGDFLLSNARWTVVFDVPTDHFQSHINDMREALEHIDFHVKYLNESGPGNICRMKSANEKDTCLLRTTVAAQKIIRQSLNDLSAEMYSYHWVCPRPTKTKRGLINVVGSGLKFLFGVADSNDIKKINKNIGNVKNVVKEALHYMTEQATYINHTIDVVIQNRHAVNR